MSDNKYQRKKFTFSYNDETPVNLVFTGTYEKADIAPGKNKA